MTLPASIKVGPFGCAVVADEAVADAASVRGGLFVRGQFDPKALTILIRPSLHRDQQACALLHEGLHVMNFLIGQWEYDKDLTEERHVTLLAPVLLAFVRDNPDVIAYCQDREGV